MQPLTLKKLSKFNESFFSVAVASPTAANDLVLSDIWCQFIKKWWFCSLTQTHLFANILCDIPILCITKICNFGWKQGQWLAHKDLNPESCVSMRLVWVNDAVTLVLFLNESVFWTSRWVNDSLMNQHFAATYWSINVNCRNYQ